ncbi:MAG: Reverse transcriptase protein [Parcubacteria group bacterium]|nr:Reverse transcriptase protein [Parcubacteria group bacterium]
MDFELHLEDNLFRLYEDLRNLNYKHSSYKYFQVFDNKKRDIYKAEVRDRIVHQIIYDHLLSLYEPEFISDSYASRIGKGQYKAIDVFRYFIKLNYDNNKPCFILKCDVRKYFDSVDQNILLNLIRQKIICEKTFAIIKEIISSYVFSGFGKGIPLGNITSQIFANIYLNDLDNYVKRELKFRFYVRYNDDFVIVSESKKKLEEIRNKTIIFAREKLSLDIPLQKTCIRKIDWGVDFLGFTVLLKAVLLRDKTKDKMYANINSKNACSYFGILKHCNSYNLKRKILSMERSGEI